MNIKEIKINNYGNLENKEINLENGINIVYGKNESGKSTLLNYIKNIFYGISKNKNGRDISDYERYKPWGKEDFSGKLKYELDNKKEFEIYRDFNKKNPKIFNENLEEISKEFNIDKKDGSQFFYDQTKIDETMFLSTVVSMQQEVKLDKQSQQVLVQKLANLAGTGDDNISFEKVIAKLNKRQVEEVGTERTQGKPINIVKDRMKQIELAIRDMNSSENEKTILEEREKALKEEINSLQLEKSINEQLESIYLKGNFEKEKIELKEKIKQEAKERAKQKRATVVLKKKVVVYIALIFAMLLVVSYRNSLITEDFNKVKSLKAELATLQKENQQTQVSIESNLNLNKIEEEAKCKLGMQKLTNDQKIYISLPKKDYVQSSNNSTETTTEKSWFEKIIDKIKGN